MEAAGFVSIDSKSTTWPIGTWHQDRRQQHLGSMAKEHVDEGLENWAMRRITRDIGWEKEKVHLLCANVRQQLSRPGVHVVQDVKVVYGVKPYSPGQVAPFHPGGNIHPDYRHPGFTMPNPPSVPASATQTLRHGSRPMF